MGLITNGSSGAVAFSSTPKSVCQYKSATNQRGKCLKLTVTGLQPAGGSDTPLKIRPTMNSATFGTFSGGVYHKEDNTNPETPTATFGGSASVEPTSPIDLGMTFYVNPQLGVIQEYDPNIQIPGGYSLQWEVTASGSETPSACITCRYEE